MGKSLIVKKNKVLLLSIFLREKGFCLVYDLPMSSAIVNLKNIHIKDIFADRSKVI